MKIFSRAFTRTEKILILALALILLGLFYYQFVDKNVRATLANNESEAKMLRTELDAAEKRLAELQSVQGNLDELEAEGKLSWMASYNNGKAEVAFLNDVLSDALEYSVTFSEVTRNGDQIRRRFTLQYRTKDYATAQRIVASICASEDRCVVDDITCTIDKDGIVTIKQSATFYETMVGGTPDAGLPADAAAANR